MKFHASIWLQFILVGALWGSVGPRLDPKVLVDGYEACNRRLQTVCYELETTLEREEGKRGKRVYEIKYCSRNEAKQWLGRWTQYNPDGTIDPKASAELIDIYGDGSAVHFTFNDAALKGDHPATAGLTRNSRDKWLQDYAETAPYGGSLAGRFMGGGGQSIADLLKAATKLKFENKATKIMGHDGWLVEADTPLGTVRAWISPELGHNCLKWDIVKRRGDYMKDGRFIGELRYTTTFAAEKVEQVDGQYVVTQASLHYTAKAGKTALADNTYHFSLKNIDLSPDYEAMGAFKIQLPEGTIVTDVDNPPARYRWAGGQLAPLPPETRKSDKPEVVLPPKPERPAGVNEDLSPVSKDNLVRHVQALAGLKSRHISQPGNSKAEEYITRELEKYGYSPKADAFQASEATTHNVLSGSSDKQRPVLLFSAHFDSAARQRAQAPGADDNASGVAVLLELARIVKEHPVQKNVEFAFFNCEESGRTGSKHLSDEYRDNHWPIDYVINVDTIGAWKGPLSNAYPLHFVTDANSAAVLRLFAEQFPYPLRQARTFWRDDHARFWDNGFKAIELTEDDDCNVHMHRPTDTPEKLDYDNLARIVHGLYKVLSQDG